MARAKSKAAYMISAVAEQYGVHPQTLRLYEREGLLKPSRSEGNTRLYTAEDVERLEVILHLTRDLGVNLAGVEIILNMREKMGRDAVADPGIHRHAQPRTGGPHGAPAGARRAHLADPGRQRPPSGSPGPPQKLSAMRHPTLSYIAPFVAFIAVMAVEKATGLPAAWMYSLRVAVTLAVLLIFSRSLLTARPTRPLLSALVGAAVFALWIAPEVIFGPAYRHFWPFHNSITGAAASSIPFNLRRSLWFLTLRTASCALLVPPVEELFWRGWAMRWLIASDFRKIPLGAYQASAFWLVALMFAAEHGPYWEVGLATGIVYNLWMVRTRNLTDCIIAHAVTNGLLSAYILATGHLHYWL